MSHPAMICSYTHLACIILMPILLFVHADSGSAFARSLDDKSVNVTGPPSFKLTLTSLDFGLPNATLIQGLQRGLRRSFLRLKHFQHVTSMPGMAKDGVSFETPVSAAASAEFVTTASIGTPPVSFTAIIDTGSDLVWRQCLPCEHCFEQDSGTIFDPSHSSTYEQAPCSDTLCSALARSTCSSGDYTSSCSYTYSYGDQSFTEGDLSYDTLTLQDLAGRPHSLSRFAFGCGHNNKGNDGNFAGAGGLIGFGQGPLSLPSQLHMPKFSYCLQPISDAASRTSPLFIGSAADIQSTSPSDSVSTTPLVSSPSAIATFYYVNLKGISVGSKALDIPAGTFDIQEGGSGGVIFDSGTTLTYLAAEAYDAVVAAFKASIPLPSVDAGSGVDFHLCYSTSAQSKLREKAPTFIFHFQGADMQLPFDNYFLDVTEKLACLALGRSDSELDQLSIIGNIQQQNFHILYDLEARSISFAPAACDTL